MPAAAVFVSFIATTVALAVIVGTRHLHARLTDDRTVGPQKFHVVPTPRIAGLAIILGLALATIVLGEVPADVNIFALTLVFASIPAFLGGIVEDVTKKVSVKHRLYLTFFSAAIAFIFLDARITSVDLPLTDRLFAISTLSFLFTVFAVGGFAHAFNIVDGFNGIAGGVALLMLGAIAAVAAMVGDQAILAVSLTVAAAAVAFLVFNFPRGLIFAGDGGAYLLGFLIAELALLLTHRNSEVSPWFPLVLLFYPVFETCFSIYRKKVLRGHSPGDPDGIHLHMLIYKRLVRWSVGSSDARDKVTRNSLTAPYLWALCAVSVVPAVAFWNDTLLLQVFCLGFSLLYLWLYWAIVRFKTPPLLVLRNQRSVAQTELDSAASEVK